MKQKTPSTHPKNPGRRNALRRLGGAVFSAYVIPEIVFLSKARAGDDPSAPSASSAPSAPDPSAPSTPAPSSPSPSAPSPETGGENNARREDDDNDDTCNPASGGNDHTISISRADLTRSEEAIKAGYAQPLDQIWGNFASNYDGKVVSVEFIGGRRNARYRFRSISASGRLETVVVSAQTGEILRIVGC